MGLYDAMKDAMSLAQKADNIELYRQLLDLGAQALELQAEITRLKEENAELKKGNDIENRIVRHKRTYITLTDNPFDVKYCSLCWDNRRKLVQLDEVRSSYSTDLYCYNCKTRCQPDNMK